MERSYEFYSKRFNWNKEYVDKLHSILINLENDNIIDEEIKSNGENLLHMCVCESNMELFKKLISPFPFKTGEVIVNPTTLIKSERVRYHYLIDFYSLVGNGFFNNYPNSIMEAYSISKMMGIEKSLEEVSKDIVLLSNYNKSELLRVAGEYNYNVINNMRVKDVLSRRIYGNSIMKSKDDIKLHCEIPTAIPVMNLHDKNIQTLVTSNSFSSDKKDNQLYDIAIFIDYDSLSDNNKFIFNLMCAKGEAKVIHSDQSKDFYCIYTRVTPNQEVSDVIYELNQIIDNFERQDYLYGKVDFHKSVSDIANKLKKIGREDIVNSLRTPKDVVTAANSIFDDNYIYDDFDESIWSCEEDYLRHKEYTAVSKLKNRI